MPSEPKRKSRFFPGLILGFIAGAVAAVVAPSWWQSLVPDALFPGGAMQSRVLGKSREEGRLLLKLETDGGVLLATFTQKVEEIDLLVDKGDAVTLRAERYEPFLTDPRLDRVTKSEYGESASSADHNRFLDDDDRDHTERMRRKLFVLALVLCLPSCKPRVPPADLVLRNGRIYTLDDARTWAEALAIDEGRIVYVGPNDGVDAFAGPESDFIDLDGKMVLPGFHDSHVHPVSGGVELGQCDLNGIATREGLFEAIAECAARTPDEEWLVGGGWDLPLFPGASPDRVGARSAVAGPARVPELRRRPLGLGELPRSRHRGNRRGDAGSAERPHRARSGEASRPERSASPRPPSCRSTFLLSARKTT